MDRFFKFLLSFVMLVTVFVFGSSCGLDRKIHNIFNPEYETTSVRYVIQKGDTVWDVAEYYFLQQDKIRNFNEFVYMVRRHNNLNQSKRMVQPGDVIIIPLSKRLFR